MMDARYTEEGFCHTEVEVRDTYRYSGGKHQFRLHYNYRHCKRKAVDGNYCNQHAKINQWWESRLKPAASDGAAEDNVIILTPADAPELTGE